MRQLAASSSVPYLDYSAQPYATTDGNHLQRTASTTFSPGLRPIYRLCRAINRGSRRPWLWLRPDYPGQLSSQPAARIPLVADGRQVQIGTDAPLRYQALQCFQHQGNVLVGQGVAGGAFLEEVVGIGAGRTDA